MLGTTNAGYDVDNAINETPYTQDLVFKAGGPISKGDLVEVITEALPDEPTVNTTDTAAASFLTLTKPCLLENNPAIFQAFHMNQANVANLCSTGTAQGAGGPQHVWSSSWSSALTTITNANTLTNNRLQLSTYGSYCWGQPLYIGNGYWLIPGDTTSQTNFADPKNPTGDLLVYPSQVLLVYIDQSSGNANTVDILYDGCMAGSALWTTAWQYGQPIICQISQGEFVFIHKILESGSYGVVARAFKITYDDVDPLHTTMNWTSEHTMVGKPKTSVITNYAQCCHFVNKEHRQVFFLGPQHNFLYSVELEYNGGLVTKSALEIDIDRTLINEIDMYTKAYDIMAVAPLVVPYHNNFASYNCIESKDGSHFLNVYNYYYWDFEIKYTTDNIVVDGINHEYFNPSVRARVVPFNMDPLTIRITQAGNANATTFMYNNNQYKDWDQVQHTIKAFRCNSNLGNSTGQIPFLWKVSEDKYLMAYLSSVTASKPINMTATGAQAQVAMPVASNGAPMFVMLDYNDTLHTLERNDYMAHCPIMGTAITYPAPDCAKNIIFVDPAGYIHHIVPVYQSGYFNYSTYRNSTRLSFSQMNNLVYRYGTKPISKQIGLKRYMIGIAKNAAAYGEDVTLVTMPEEMSMLFKSIDEGGIEA